MKKIATLGVILSLTLVIIPVNTYATQNNLTGLKSNENNIEMSPSFDDLSLNDLEYFLGGNTSGKDWEAGFVEVNSTGKGFHLIWPIKILKLDLPIPTIQYHNIFPLKFDLFIIKCRYCDENAKTIISVINDSGEWYDKEIVTGNHEITFFMFKIPVLNILRNLLADGLIDGIQPIRQFIENILHLKGVLPPGAFILTKIRDFIFKGPLINYSKQNLSFLRDLSGVPPRYKGDQIFNSLNLSSLLNFSEQLEDYFPLISTSLNRTINNLISAIEVFKVNNPIMSNFIGNTTNDITNFFKSLFRSNVILISGSFWNRMPLRTSLLHIVQPQQLKGYGFFVRWKKLSASPPIINCLQTLFHENWFYQDIKLI